MRHIRAARRDGLDLLTPVRELDHPCEAGRELERPAHADELEVLVAEVAGVSRDGLALVADDLEPAVEHEGELGYVLELQHAGVERGVLCRRRYERAVVSPCHAHHCDAEREDV